MDVVLERIEVLLHIL